MGKKGIKYGVFIVVLSFLAYKSIYIKKLDEVKAEATGKQFDAAFYARTYLEDKLPPGLEKATDINLLTLLLQKDRQGAFDRYSHALGIGNIRFFLVRGQGLITSIDENDAYVLVRSDSLSQVVPIATEYVFGNAIRDASGLININEFSNTMDFNNVSAEINKMIRTKVLPPFKARERKGMAVSFTGAVELNKAHPGMDHMEVMPITLKVINQ